MSLACLHSSNSLGTDIDRRRYAASVELEEASSLGDPWVEMRQVRVVVGDWGPLVRLSAPDLDLVAEGDGFDEAWREFVQSVALRPDSAWLMFDVSRVRDDEASEALNAQEAELWSHRVDDDA